MIIWVVGDLLHVNSLISGTNPHLAYTSTTATQFNGFRSSHDVLYVNSEIPTKD